MLESNIETEIARMMIIMDTYKKIFKTNDKLTILNLIRCINRAFPNTIDDLNIKNWLENFDKNKRDDQGLTNNINYKIFLTLFEKPKDYKNFIHTNIDLGSCVLATYLDKNINLGIEFTENPGVEIYEKFVKNPLFNFLGKLELTKRWFEKSGDTMKPEEKKVWDKVSFGALRVFNALNDPRIPFDKFNKEDDTFNKKLLNYLRYEIGSDKEVKDIVHSLEEAEKVSNLTWPPSPIQFKKAKRICEESLSIAYKKRIDIEKLIKTYPQLEEKINQGIKDEQTSPFLLKLFKYNFLCDLMHSGKSLYEFFDIRSKWTRKTWKDLVHQKTVEVIIGKNIPKDLTLEDAEKLHEGLKTFENAVHQHYATEIFPEQLKNYENYLAEDLGWDILAFKGLYSKLIKHLENIDSSCKDKLLSKIYAKYSIYCSGTKKIQNLRKSLKFDHDNLNAHYTLAKQYENEKNDKKAKESWTNLVKCYFKTRDTISLKLFSNTTNDIGQIEDERLDPVFIMSDMIIKRSKENMDKEYILMKQFYDQSPDKRLVPKPIEYIKHRDGYNYLIMREEHEEKGEDEVRTLAKTVDYIDKLVFKAEDPSSLLNFITKDEILNKLKVQYLQKSLDQLVKFQETLKSLSLKKEEYDITGIVEQKISKRLNGGKRLKEALQFLTMQIYGQEKCFTHGDYHPGNILIKNNKIIPIDFEYAGYTPLLYDSLFLLENPSLNLDNNTKEYLIKYYLKEKNISFDESWKKDIDYMSLFITLRWAGISSKWKSLTNDEKYTSMKLMSLNKSEKIIDKMLAYTSDTEYLNLQKLKDCLKELYQ